MIGAVDFEGDGDFEGLVGIGGGRQMFLECRGTGSPTVVFISGRSQSRRHLEHSGLVLIDTVTELLYANLTDEQFAEPPSFAPGTEFEYSSTNTILLGMLLEKVEGKTLDRIFADRFFGPLGMSNTALPDPDVTTVLVCRREVARRCNPAALVGQHR